VARALRRERRPFTRFASAILTLHARCNRGTSETPSRGGEATDLTVTQIEYLATQRLGRIATAGADHKPQVVPTSYRYNPDLGTIDVSGRDVAATKKYRDVQANGWAAIVIDDLVSTDPWTPRMLEIRGRAEAIPPGGAVLGRGFGESVIRIHPDKVNSFGLP